MKRTKQCIPARVTQMAGSARRFKQNKRREIRAVLSAIHTFRLGCAYIPGGSTLVEEMENIAWLIAKALSVKEWGR